MFQRFSLLTLVALAACSQQNVGPAVAPVANSNANARPATTTPTITGTYTKNITFNGSVEELRVGFDGRIWFAEFNASKIGAITTSGTVTEYPTVGGGQPLAIVRGTAALFAGGYGGVLMRTASNGAQTDYTASGAHVAEIASSAKTGLWFTDYGNNTLDRLNSNGTVSTFAIGTGAEPFGLAVGSDGNLWVCDYNNEKIVKVNASGKVLATYGGLTNEHPNYMIAAPDGNLYFTEVASGGLRDAVARITTAGKITQLGSFGKNVYPYMLAIGKDKNVYFTFVSTPALGKVDTATGKTTAWKFTVAHDNGFTGITSGPDGRLWLGGFYTVYAVSY